MSTISARFWLCTACMQGKKKRILVSGSIYLCFRRSSDGFNCVLYCSMAKDRTSSARTVSTERLDCEAINAERRYCVKARLVAVSYHEVRTCLSSFFHFVSAGSFLLLNASTPNYPLPTGASVPLCKPLIEK